MENLCALRAKSDAYAEFVCALGNDVDTGTGRLRGASIFGPPEAAAALRPISGAVRRLGPVRRDADVEPRHWRDRQHVL
jgi:hypothetical protein